MLAKKFTVLVVDDEINVVKLLVRLLSRIGVDNVVTAGSGLKGIEVFGYEAPDAVITDFLMPNMNGIGLLTHIKNLAPEVPVIMFTGFIEKLEENLEKETVKPDFIMDKAQVNIQDFIDSLNKCFPDKNFKLQI